jgi:hypothetical protein
MHNHVTAIIRNVDYIPGISAYEPRGGALLWGLLTASCSSNTPYDDELFLVTHLRGPIFAEYAIELAW